jgi:tRNA(adenine34) deaminase
MNHEKYMKKALKEAQKALNKGEVPVGAVVVCDGKIVGKGHNLREKTHKSTAHAEIVAIEQANKKMKSWRLDNCTIYVTIEPCPMCSGAIIQSRIKQVVYGASETKSGSHHSVTNLFDQPYRHKVDVLPGVMEEECGEIVATFFQQLRQK